uniref:ATP synthase subunit a n=1 Tax=Pomphorhynchus tereticollis TaxID=255491 RepID=A0A806H3K4_9BILA|nr:ATP synthase F0 subunit 6 [Pomphorhynchus tereticollis]AFJ14714.1 ATP synthase F0 subunit 6 [Pomphorhynchus tereticollis]AFJ14726.1 ATP synthase F0 subunit 6 [Pomphorhynchus tereticollis]AFJ14762.1 ATP synthase F0 subunit 6 [Pomphorhynchus tereticollis]
MWSLICMWLLVMVVGSWFWGLAAKVLVMLFNHSAFSFSLLMSVLSCLMVTSNFYGLLSVGVWTMGYGVVCTMSLMCWIWGVFWLVEGAGVGLYLAHFSIAGVSGPLGLFLPLAELVSVLVRPLTLGVRLATNISSGHVLMLMMSLLLGGVSLSVALTPLWLAVVCLEMFVALLQGVIYSMLVVIYVE